jgi:uncharacterized secreted protein with C-terminal beta-propeller domain
MLRPHPSPTLLLALPLLLAACSDSGERQRPPWTASRTTALEQYESCRQLESDIKAKALEELDAIIEQYGNYNGGDGDGASPPGAPAEDGAGGADGGGRQEGTDYSGTNNQEEGVDEADLVKTDGYNLYLVNGNHLHVFGVPEFGELDVASDTELEGYPYQLLLDADRSRLAVFSHVDVEQLPGEHPLRDAVGRSQAIDSLPYRTYALSKITIFDVSDPAALALDREVWVEGWYQTARRTDHSVRVVANGNILVPGLDDMWTYWNGGQPDLDDIREQAAERIADAELDDMIPRLYERRPNGSVRIHSLAGEGCRSFYFPTDSSGRTTTTILSFELGAEDLRIDADTVVSNWSTVYASRDRLYLAESAWPNWWNWSRIDAGELFIPKTNIHAFDVSTAGKAAYVGSGRIDGTVLNQFSLDEQDGLLRVAASTNPWRQWNPDGTVEETPAPESHIYILEEKGDELETVGQLDGIAPNEQIFAARFLADEAFLVTFEQVDPLFTIDLSDPRSPKLTGELEVPGFSTYLHPIADDRILAIGVGGDENGANWNAQISLFDVSNRAEPSLMDTHELVSSGWGWSEALYEHKAFQYFAPKKMLAVPMSSYREVRGPNGEWNYLWDSKLELLNVDAETGVSRHGAVDHSRFYDGTWWGQADVRRSIFMGDFIYAVSSNAVTVNRLDDLTEVKAELLPFQTEPYWWW